MTTQKITPPKFFYCNKCNRYFFTESKLEKPTCRYCHSHNTRLATKEEIKTLKVEW